MEVFHILEVDINHQSVKIRFAIKEMQIRDIRFLLADYIESQDDESVFRDECLNSIRQTEGFSVERLGQILRLLPPSSSDFDLPDFSIQGQDLVLEKSDTIPIRCFLRLPAEYRSTRRYPVVLSTSYLTRSNGEISMKPWTSRGGSGPTSRPCQGCGRQRKNGLGKLICPV